MFSLPSVNQQTNAAKRKRYHQQHTQTDLQNPRPAPADVFDYIEAFYHRTRCRSHLGGVSPKAFERASICG